VQPIISFEDAVTLFAITMLASEVFSKVIVIVKIMVITILAVVMPRALHPMLLQPHPGVKGLIAIVTIVMFAGIPPVIPACPLAREGPLALLALVASASDSSGVQSALEVQAAWKLAAVAMLALEMFLELAIVVKLLMAVLTVVILSGRHPPVDFGINIMAMPDATYAANGQVGFTKVTIRRRKD
jgi:hypothetical protein